MSQMNTDSRMQNRDPVTHDIIGSAFEVHKELGYGFLEKVYQRAMQAELALRNRKAELEHQLKVHYKSILVGDYVADLLVDGRVLVELKIAPEYQTADEAQLLNELKASGIRIGMLINFGRERVEFKRMVF